MSADHELQKAIHATLAGDAALVALLGGARIYDAVPQEAPFPYVAFGATRTRDFGTGTEPGREHFLTLDVWSRAAGLREARLILAAIEAALAAAPPAPAGHRLVNLVFEEAELRRAGDGETVHATARYRAVTEADAGA